MRERQFKDCDGDTWTEFEPGELRITEYASGALPLPKWTSSIRDVQDDHGPLTEIRTDVELDRDRLDRALRAYVAELDYDIHKGIECSEVDGVDRYGEEVDFFIECWEEAASGEPR